MIRKGFQAKPIVIKCDQQAVFQNAKLSILGSIFQISNKAYWLLCNQTKKECDCSFSSHLVVIKK